MSSRFLHEYAYKSCSLSRPSPPLACSPRCFVGPVRTFFGARHNRNAFCPDSVPLTRPFHFDAVLRQRMRQVDHFLEIIWSTINRALSPRKQYGSVINAMEVVSIADIALPRKMRMFGPKQSQLIEVADGPGAI